jgi:hypothetical protein
MSVAERFRPGVGVGRLLAKGYLNMELEETGFDAELMSVAERCRLVR